MDQGRFQHFDNYQIDQQAEERCRQRLKEDLGLDDEAVEVVMNLRSQVKTLQTRLRQVEFTLQVMQTSQGSRLIHYRREIYEGDWEEL
jgi:hypothetical protein